MAFQIWDDVRDLVCSEEHLGKPAGHDMVEGTYTLPVLRALAIPGAGDDLRALLGGPLDPPARDKARDLVLSTPAVSGCVLEARRWAEQADSSLDLLRRRGRIRRAAEPARPGWAPPDRRARHRLKSPWATGDEEGGPVGIAGGSGWPASRVAGERVVGASGRRAGPSGCGGGQRTGFGPLLACLAHFWTENVHLVYIALHLSTKAYKCEEPVGREDGGTRRRSRAGPDRREPKETRPGRRVEHSVEETRPCRRAPPSSECAAATGGPPGRAGAATRSPRRAAQLVESRPASGRHPGGAATAPGPRAGHGPAAPPRPLSPTRAARWGRR